MRTYIDIDDTLMAKAQKATGYRTKKQTVEEALRLLVRLRQQREVNAAPAADKDAGQHDHRGH